MRKKSNIQWVENTKDKEKLKRKIEKNISKFFAKITNFIRKDVYHETGEVFYYGDKRHRYFVQIHAKFSKNF